MTFFNWSKPAFFFIKQSAKNFARGFVHGVIDELQQTFTDSEITRFADAADTLKKCEPGENHLTRDAYNEINKALKAQDYQAALVDVSTKCTTLLKEALPQGIVVPKNKLK